MALSNNLTPGMTISIGGKHYRVESSVKVTVPKGTPFIKTKLRDVNTHELVEKNFKLNQTIQDLSLSERKLEFLYVEGNGYLFLDVGNLEQVLIPGKVVGDKASYLKEGVELKASFHGNAVFAVDLPQFLELMVSKIGNIKGDASSATKIATLETGAEVEVPPFIEAGDIIKVDTKLNEYIQRV